MKAAGWVRCTVVLLSVALSVSFMPPASALVRLRPDLKVTALSTPTGAIEPDDSFSVHVVTSNVGRRRARASTTMFSFSIDQLPSATDVTLDGQSDVPLLGRRASFPDDVTVTAPNDIPLGTYFIIACADVLKTVRERSERNNCRATSSTVLVGDGPVVAITAPAANATTSSSGTITYSTGDSVSVSCTLDGSPTSCDLSGSTPFSDLSGGQHTIGITGTDSDGLTGHDLVTWNVDAAPPVVTSLSVAPNGAYAVLASFGLSDASTITEVHCVLDGADTTCGSGGSGSKAYDSLSTGSHTIEVYGVDEWSNSGSAAVATPVPAVRATLLFSVTEPPAVLRLNEVNVNQTTGDLIEIRVITGGTLSAETLRQEVASPTTLATLPDVVVVANDLIVVHLSAGGGVTTETGTKTACADPACYAGAWDVVGAATGVAFSNHVLTVNDPGGVIQDGVPFVNGTSSTLSSYPVELQALQAAGEWQPSDCGGSPCTYASSPTAYTVSADWAGIGNSPADDSVQRSSPADSDAAADWHVTAGSFGSANP